MHFPFSHQCLYSQQFHVSVVNADFCLCLPFMYIAPDKRYIQNIIFLFLYENICCGYSLEVPHCGTSNEYPQHMFSKKGDKQQNKQPTTVPLTLFIMIVLVYSRLSLSRIPRDSLKYFEISVVRHIRFAELRKK